jgi:hypothetical protein
VRAQISQIEKYQTAANTFRGKYGYLPGDIPNPYAAQFGFQARGPYAGQGDGNGLIQGAYANAPNNNWDFSIFTGEQAMFWVDLGKAGLIDGTFSTATPTAVINSNITGAAINQYLPQAKISAAGYVYIWSGGWQGYLNATSGNGLNYFSVSGVTGAPAGGGGTAAAVPVMTVAQAYAIDKKMDDGMPQSGGVMAMDGSMLWASGGPVSGTPPSENNMGDYDFNNFGPITTATASPTYDDQNGATSSQTCYSNGDTKTPEQYSVGVNAGAGVNCVLSFRFQ